MAVVGDGQVRALVGEGQTAIAGETVLADLKASEPNRTFSMT